MNAKVGCDPKSTTYGNIWSHCQMDESIRQPDAAQGS